MTIPVSRIVRHELRVLLRDGVVAMTLLVFLGATVAAVLSGRSWVARQAGITDAIREDEAERFQRLAERLADIEAGRYVATDPYEDPSRASIAGGWWAYRFAVAPPSPLAPLAVGQTDLQASYRGVTIWSTLVPSFLTRRVLISESEIDNPANLVAGRFDVSFVVVFLLPLAIILVTHGLVADERDGGTLALLAAQPVSPRVLLAVRLATRLVPIAAIWIVLAGACLLMAGAGPGDAYARAAAWLTATLVYILFWCALCAYAATWPGSSGVSVLRLAGAWLLLVVVLPAALNAWTTWTIPLPDGVTLMQEARSAQLDAERANSVLTEAVYAREPALRPENAAPDVRRYAATTVLAQQLEVERRLSPLVQTFAERAAQQAAAIERLGVWSPATAATAALADAAGTGPERHRHFTARADAYREEWRAYFVPRMFRLERVTVGDVAHFPRFQFADEAAATVVWRVLGRLPVLGIATLLLSWRAWARASRLDVVE